MSVSTGSVSLAVASVATHAIVGPLTRQTIPPCPSYPACPTCPCCPGAAATLSTPASPGLSVDSSVGWWSLVLIVISVAALWLARGLLPVSLVEFNSSTPRVDVVAEPHGGGASVGARRVDASPVQRRHSLPMAPTFAAGDDGAREF